jgi:hypothetical protein
MAASGMLVRQPERQTLGRLPTNSRRSDAVSRMSAYAESDHPTAGRGMADCARAGLGRTPSTGQELTSSDIGAIIFPSNTSNWHSIPSRNPFTFDRSSLVAIRI